jgi:small neutral amino acid transporter SnatA (MarC family)
MKFAHDHLRYKHAKYIDRYFDIVGRLSALLIGTIAVDMIVNGIMGLIESASIIK